MSFQATFEAFASFGTAPSKEMTNKNYIKMLKDAKIVGKVFTSTDADLLFSKIKPKGGQKIDFTTFKSKGVPEIATKMKKTADEVEAMICAASPQTNATKADNVKFHDDKNLYTGVHKSGGPTNVDRNAGSLAGVVDRRVETVDNRGTTSKQV